MLTFTNSGEIDPRSITTFGVSAKDTETPIGFFGTGLKYAIAIILRSEGSITIRSGMDSYEFTTRVEIIRGKPFELIYMNSTPLGFTTELGKNWEMWQAFREIYSNMLDEGGSMHVGMPSPTWKSGITSLSIRCPEFEAIAENVDSIFISGTPLISLPGVDVHEPVPGGHVYFRGVRVGQLDRPSKFTYNIIAPILLTEDRTVLYPHQIRDSVARAIFASPPSTDIRQLLSAHRDNFEHSLVFPADSWESIPEHIKGFVEKAIATFDTDLLEGLKRLHKKFLDEALMYSAVASLTRVEERQLEKARNFCAFMKYPVSFPITVSENLGADTLGAFYKDHIYISRRVFQQGTKQVCTTLLEEQLHGQKGFEDLTYEFQNFLFDVIAGLVEDIQGDPL